MVFITAQEILETVSMIRSENLDVRAVTMGISLSDCADREPRRTAERIHAKIVRRAGRLVEVAAELQEKYGVPIVNRRVSVTPIADVVGSDDPTAYVEVAHALDAAADEVGIDFLGGFSALVQKGFTRSDTALIEAIPDAIGATQRVCSSVNVASTRAGINMDAVLRMADVLLAVSKRTADARLHRLRQDRRSSATRRRTTPSWPARCTAAARPRPASTWPSPGRAWCATSSPPTRTPRSSSWPT